jgi:hypothetical protein
MGESAVINITIGPLMKRDEEAYTIIVFFSDVKIK